jgi:hypothetical protein
MKFAEYLNESKVKPSDFKKGDKVEWGSSFSSREKDMKGEIIGFKDHEDYKHGYLVIKGDDKKEYKLIFTAVQKVKDVNEHSESVIVEGVQDKSTWDDADAAAEDVLKTLEKSGLKVKKSGSNSIKIQHKNGSVGSLVFDPTNKY